MHCPNRKKKEYRFDLPIIVLSGNIKKGNYNHIISQVLSFISYRNSIISYFCIFSLSKKQRSKGKGRTNHQVKNKYLWFHFGLVKEQTWTEGAITWREAFRLPLLHNCTLHCNISISWSKIKNYFFFSFLQEKGVIIFKKYLLWIIWNKSTCNI